MINQKIVKIIKSMIAIVVATIIFTLGYLLGDGLRMKEQKEHTKVEQLTVEASAKQEAQQAISKAYVKEFLIALYTRKELEENRQRYKPFMTDGLYHATISEENKAVNQAYKGYIVDQVFDDANIYIDSDKKEIIVTVKYSSVLLAVKNDYSRQTNHTATETIKLTYVMTNQKPLFNTLEYMTLEKSTIPNSLYKQKIPLPTLTPPAPTVQPAPTPPTQQPNTPGGNR